jgi:lambda family phage tail tape measure protein
MTQEKKVQTAAVMDVTGVERSAQDAVRAARTMAEGITREGEKAGKGLEAMGAGAEKAERTVDAKTKTISDRIRRLTQQSQRELAGLAASSSGGPGSASAVEYEATIRGADVAKLQPQIAALRELQTQATALSAAMRQAMVGDEFIAGINSRITALQRQSAGAKMAEADMLALRAAELGVAQQADPLIAKLRATAAAADEAAAASRRAAAGDSFLSGLKAQAGAIGKTRADLLELKAAELGVTQQSRAMIQAIRDADNKLYGIGATSKATAAALRTVPAQFTDIVVSLQAGQKPLQVFLQQGGQLKDQFGGIGPAARALGGYIAGLVNPFTVAAAAVGVLGSSFLVANSGISAATRTLIESGNQAGITANQLQMAAEASAALGGATTNRAAELLASLAKAGDLGAQGLERYVSAALNLERAGGQAADKTVEAFNELGKSPVTAALRLNDSTNFLTSSIYRQIKSLEEQGRTAEAARVAADAYADAIEGRTPGMEASLNVLQRAWRGVAEEAKSALEQYLSAFRVATTQDQISDIRKQIAELEAAGQKGYVFGPSISDLRERERNLQELLRLDQRSVERDRTRKQQLDASVVVERFATEALSKEEKLKAELGRFNNAADLDGTDPEKRARIEAAIRAKYTDKATGERGLGRALLAEQLQDIRSAEQERAAIYRQSEAIIEAQRRAGLLSEAEYYDARRGFIALDEASRTSALQAEIGRLQQFKGTAAEEAQARRDLTAATGKLNQARTEAAGRAALLAIEEQSLIDGAQAELQIQRTRADAEIDRIREGSRDYKTAAGMGDRRRTEFLEEINLKAEFTRRKAALEEDYVRGKFAGREEEYRQELTLLITEEGRQLQALEEFQRKKREADANYRNGLSSGIENVIDDTFQTANRTARLTEDAFKGLGDALTDVFTKGKLSWSSLEQTILKGITRIIVEQQLIRPIAQFLQGGSAAGGFLDFAGSILGNLLGGATGGSGMPDGVPTRGGRAMGGPVQAGGLYPVNELAQHGPGEILTSGGKQYLMARQNGYVQPMAQASSGMQVVNNFHISGPVDRRTQQQIATAAGRGAQQAMARNG